MKTLSRSVLFVLAAGLAACSGAPADSVVWHLDNLDEIGGHKVTVEGDPRIIETSGGPAVEFDGVDDAIFLDVHPLAGISTFTVEVIFNPYAGGEPEQRFFHMQDGTSDERVMFETRLPGDGLWFLDTFINSAGQKIPLYAEDSQHETGQWYHAAIVVDGDSFTHFVNGQMELSEPMQYQAQASGRTSLGVRINKVNWFKGAIRTVRVTPRALTAEEFLAVPEARIAGELRRWHPITLTFNGPSAKERGDTNPFLDNRLDVAFTHKSSGATVEVPGYFAADGNAAETGANAGDKWRVHFVPREVGEWSYAVSFRTGRNVAISTEPGVGTAVAPDGRTGEFVVAESDKTGSDHRSRGFLNYVGERYPRFDNGEYFLKAGADSPETLLAYGDFDNTYDHGGSNSIKSYAAHVADWYPGDPTWHDDKGKGLIGALNYLAGKGMNAVSFLTMNVTGDGKNVWPWLSHVERDRYDVSKLAQWEMVFSHADTLGLFLHFKTQETENDLLLDGGKLGPERKLYYRELIARFGHHLALNWNLGEENDTWEELEDPDEVHVRSVIRYVRELDPYDHPIVIHSYPDQQAEVYTPLLGPDVGLAGPSLQTQIENVHVDTGRWLRESAAAGAQWMVANDEIGPANVGVKPDGEDNNHFDTRYQSLWGNLMAGGWGVEYYFGYKSAHNDLNAEDWRSRDISWDQARHALHFFRQHLPFTTMEVADELTDNNEDYVFAKAGEVYAIYLPRGVETTIDLGDVGGEYSVRWYNPRSGGDLQQGSIAQVNGPGPADVGKPPIEHDLDWAILIKRL